MPQRNHAQTQIPLILGFTSTMFIEPSAGSLYSRWQSRIVVRIIWTFLHDLSKHPRCTLRAGPDRSFPGGGYLTAKQAATVGYWKRHLDDHVKTGNVERIQRGLSGVYRTFIKPLCKSFQPR